MAFLGQTFDENELLKSDRNFALIPAGVYDATITKADLKPTKTGGGQYIAMRCDITGPTHQGRVIFSNINIKNASTAAENIGRQQLGEIMRAIGLSKVTDTDQLVGGNVKIKISIRPSRTDEKTGAIYESSNEIKAFSSSSGSVPAFKSPQTTDAPASNPAKAAPPWAKK